MIVVFKNVVFPKKDRIAWTINFVGRKRVWFVSNLPVDP